MCVCVCVCVCERERESARERETSDRRQPVEDALEGEGTNSQSPRQLQTYIEAVSKRKHSSGLFEEEDTFI